MSSSCAAIRQLAGADEVIAALRGGTALGVVLILADAKGEPIDELLGLARSKAVRVRRVGLRVLERMAARATPIDVLALVGRNPAATLPEVLAGSGAIWLLSGASYPGNIGMAVRCAEVSGADAVVIDTSLDRPARRAVLRASIRADWYMPVLWEDTEAVLDGAETRGRRIIGIEDVGERAPAEVDLRGPLLFVIGSEANGVHAGVLERCTEVVRIPMAGFIPSYNLQAAVAIVSAERLRQGRS